MGDMLRIDLSTRTTREESIPAELVRDYIGGKGIGSHLLLNEIGPEVEPLSPQNKLFLAIGPMAGTSMGGSNRYAAFFLSPLTGGYCEAYSGGKVAAQFAKTGYKWVVLEGRADAPVYIEVSENGATIHPADDLWGLDTYEAEEQIVARTGVAGAQACVIGPAGEKLVRFACIENNKWRSLGRGGGGAVMGSKNVKGVVFHGTHKTEVARPEEFKALVRDIAERSVGDPGVANYKKMGTVQIVRLSNDLNMFANRYWTKGHLDDFEPISAETMLEKYHVKNTTCPPCFIACGNQNRVPDDHPTLAGLQIDGPEFETIYVFGGLCEIVDFPQIMRLNDICDRLGVDTMTAGNLCGLAIEACRQGKLDLGLDFGDADGVAELLTDMCLRRGKIGDLFADGILAVERDLGLEGVAVHVKGMEPPAYDPRFSKGMGLGYIMSTRGACHMRATFFKAELVGLIDPGVSEGKAPIYVDWENRFVIMDSLIYCRFYRDLVPWPYITQVVNAAIGTDYTVEDLGKLANRVVTETHEFNRRRGFGAEQERLPTWITERPIVSKEGVEMRITADELELMRREYYEARGWGAPPS